MKDETRYLVLPLRDGVVCGSGRRVVGWARVSALLSSWGRLRSLSWLPGRLVAPGVCVFCPAGASSFSVLVLRCGASAPAAVAALSSGVKG